MTEQSQGLLGSSAIIPADDLYLHNQRIGLVEPTSDAVELRFLYYLFNTLPVRDQIQATATGAKVRHTAPKRIEDVVVRFPPLPTQRKIAQVLWAYDDLIENNNRRIQVLEEVAQRIYREWFVDMRYPGYEGVQLVDSELGLLPKHWSVRPMTHVADVVDCLHSKKPAETENGPGVLLQLFNIASGGIIDRSRLYKIAADDYARWISRIELSPGDCVVTNVGRIAAVGQVPLGFKAAPGRNMTAIRPRTLPPTYLLQYLLSEHMTREVHKKQDSGAIMDALNVKGIMRLAVPVPDNALADRYEKIARPLRREIEILVAQQDNLRATRDLLLPRLVFGEIDVTDFDIAAMGIAA
jgi:type I restriction enzyme S subunit